MTVPRLTLNDGTQTPWIAFGTGTAFYRQDVTNVIQLAIENGFTHLDCAQAYSNEESVGKGISASGKPRLELEIHPYAWQSIQTLIGLHKTHNIVTSSYGGLSPLSRAQGGPLDPVIYKIRARLEATRGRHVTDGQVLNKWLQQRGIRVAEFRIAHHPRPRESGNTWIPTTSL
ncbi:hypothetical protein OG21DRAFT_1504579, partial [Imleria badia]